MGFDFRRAPLAAGAVAGAVHAEHEAADGVAAEAQGGVPALGLPAGGAGDRGINPILRGWVNYFRIGHAARCFDFVRAWVEKKVRRHMMRARDRRGFGWKRWSTAWLYDTLGVFRDYRVRYWARA